MDGRGIDLVRLAVELAGKFRELELALHRFETLLAVERDGALGGELPRHRQDGFHTRRHIWNPSLEGGGGIQMKGAVQFNS